MRLGSTDYCINHIGRRYINGLPFFNPRRLLITPWLKQLIAIGDSSLSTPFLLCVVFGYYMCICKGSFLKHIITIMGLHYVFYGFIS